MVNGHTGNISIFFTVWWSFKAGILAMVVGKTCFCNKPCRKKKAGKRFLHNANYMKSVYVWDTSEKVIYTTGKNANAFYNLYNVFKLSIF